MGTAGPHANPNPHTRSKCNPDTYTNPNPDTYTNPNPNTNADADPNTNPCSSNPNPASHACRTARQPARRSKGQRSAKKFRGRSLRLSPVVGQYREHEPLRERHSPVV
jgi:hypothetical protein